MLRYKSISEMAWLYGEQIHKKNKSIKGACSTRRKKTDYWKTNYWLPISQRNRYGGYLRFLTVVHKKHLFVCPHHMFLWRTVENYPFIIKYTPYLFLVILDQLLT